MLDKHLIRKVKDIATETQQVGGVVNRRQILNIAKVVIRSNYFLHPERVWWNCGINCGIKWCSNQTEIEQKRRGAVGTAEIFPQFLTGEKFIFKKAISTAVSRHNIQDSLVLNIDQISSAYVSPEKNLSQ